MNKSKQVKRVLALLFLFILLLAMLLLAFLAWKIEQIPREHIDRNALEQVSVPGHFTNIAIFGLDTRPGDELGTRTDTIMIASINNRSGEMRLVSVFRDTLMLQLDGSYDKASHAYAFGGPGEAVAMLNRNLDLDIEFYVAVNFASMAAIVDILGGVEIELDREEIFWTNGLSYFTAEDIGGQVPPKIDENQPGVHTLNGIQAVTFSRIRFTEGDDFRRTERQREVFHQIFHGMTRATPMQLLRMQQEVFPEMLTNMPTGQILLQGLNLIRMNLGEMTGYPFDVITGSIPGSSASYVIPVNTTENVRQLHLVLFDNRNFIPSLRLQEISSGISNLTGVW